MKQDNEIFIDFYSLLNNSQKIYEGIVRERFIIYLAGSILGIISAVLFYRNNKSENISYVKVYFYYISSN